MNFDQRGWEEHAVRVAGSEHDVDLVADIEKLREHLGLRGGRCSADRGIDARAGVRGDASGAGDGTGAARIFLLRKQEIDWFYQRGASVLYPDAWSRTAHIPEAERGSDVGVLSPVDERDAAVRLAAAKVWSGWEGATSKLLPTRRSRTLRGGRVRALCADRGTYFYKGFLRATINCCGMRRGFADSGVIVQGRYDVVCPMESAWALHRAWPEAELMITPDSGHSAFDAPNSRALVAATDRFAGCE